MADPARFAVAVLAAGQSRRFGPDDKLAARFQGALLGEAVCRTLAGLDFSRRWVIAARAEHPCAAGWQAHGFAIAVNAQAEAGLGTSVALAATLALQANAPGLLIALADMPLVPAGHFQALLARAATNAPSAIVASAADGIPMPPAAFGRDHLPRLAALIGDSGARALLDRAELVTCAPEWLIDIDTRPALDRAGRAGFSPLTEPRGSGESRE